ncbi:MAG: polysaccharide synthesis protein GtrA [Parvibaculum sp.]|nr:polysaccharide synthesis protein GtrA [Parvibaculum sp.]|tara:strand:+ start:213 stop:674 length:462 start_codon:yes stop_codon:yes gene_type:complete
MLKQTLRFGMVGLLATFVHMIIGFLLIQSNWQLLVANMLAFATAFLVSFVGHLGFSFADQDVSPLSALRKFAVAALTGFACNETLLVALLSQDAVSDTIALWVSTGLAAILTFILSRVWAFRTSRPVGVDAFPIRPDINLERVAINRPRIRQL